MFRKMRTLKVNILTLFLSLITIAFLCVFSFTYVRDYRSILEFSKGVARQNTETVLAKFKAITRSSENVTRVSGGFFPTLHPLAVQNQTLVSYMLSVVKDDPNLSNFYIGFPDGRYIGAYRLSAMKNRKFINDSEQDLPSNAVFALRSIDTQQTPSRDEWHYLDEDFRQVAYEELLNSDFKTVERPWYVGAKSNRGLFWTGLYAFSPSLEKGVTIANPLYDSKGNLVCVLAADLALRLLSDFLMRQEIGKTGKAFILDHSGALIAPGIFQEKDIPTSLLSKIYDRFSSHPEEPSFVLDWKGIEYLAYVTRLPILFGSHWMMMIVVPFNDFFGPMLKTQHEVLGMILVILFLSALVVIYFAKKISAPIVILAKEVNKIRQLELSSNVRVLSLIEEISLIDTAIDAMRRVVRSFAKYVPKEIVKDLFQKNEEIVLGGEKREVTIFFSDVSGFTSIAESHSIDVVMPLLTEYFEAMTKILLDSHATIDKFLGDGIMAFWGAPLSVADHASRACDAALTCRAMLVRLNKKRKELGVPEFQTRFGINTGVVIVGNIGTEDRMNYTVIGDAVNITSRLQEVDKVYHTSIIISQETYHHLGEEFVARPLDFVAVKGKKERTKIYELMGKRSGEPELIATPEQIALSRAFTEAYDALEQGQKERARELFLAIAEKFPEDYPTKMYTVRE